MTREHPVRWWRLLAMILPFAMPAAAGAADPYEYVQTGDTFNYLVWLPEDYAAGGQRYPLLIFLHGVGEKGNGSARSIAKVAKHGPFRSLREGNWDTSLPLVVAGPQVGGLKWWWPTDKVVAFKDYLVDHYRIDRNRIYLTGVSMGGRAAWELAESYPETIAAIIPAGAWADDLRNDCAAMRNIGVWAFHGTEDGLIRIRDGLKPVQTLRDCDPPPRYNPALTPLSGAEHGSWELVYDNRHGGRQVGADGREYENIYRWLLTFGRDTHRGED